MVETYHLEELKTYFNHEYQRKESLETKSSYMLAISSILLTIFVDILINLVNSKEIIIDTSLIILSLIFIIFSIISIVCCMINVSVLTLTFPMDICSIKNIDKLDKQELYDELYENYIKCISSNVKKIDQKVCLLRIAYFSNGLMLLSLLLILGKLFVVIY